VCAVRLEAGNLHALAAGCGVLGAGGGGDPDIGLLMALRAVQEHGAVEVVAPSDLPPDALVMPCGLIGAPTVALERIWNGDEGRMLRDAVQELRGAPVSALMPYEIAGSNGVLPVTWAARLGLPLVDADGMGRAFPEMQQQAMHLAGIPASPVVLTDGRGNTAVLHAADNDWAERLARSGATSLGGVCAGALYCMTAEEARVGAIEGSISRALRLGEAMGARRPAERLAAVCEALGATVLIDGKVLDVERRTDAGFVRGSATVEGTGPDAGRAMRLELQNEFLLAIEEGMVRASVPDIISVLATDTGDSIVTERLRYGQRVTVIASPGPDVWASEAGLAVVGPAAFGYDIGYAPITPGAGDGR
jgi:uncharacterized protein